ncbi:MAG: hypothetical protein HUU35_08040, partial [Armatimonadetes bacterium]|nr:hypothetical protein [Armatimonadota bacterium]
MAWLLALLAPCLVTAAEPLIYGSDFAAGPSGFSVQWTGSGQLQGRLDPTRRDPGGAPSWRTEAPVLSKGTVGVGLQVPAQRTWRVEFLAAATIDQGSLSANLQCFDAAGKQVDWITLTGIRNSEAFERQTAIVTVPAACHRLNLLFLHEMKGTSWIAAVRITPFEVTPAMEAQLRASGPTRWGATGYLRASDPTLRDTGAKLLVTAGVTHTRLGLDWRRAEATYGRFDLSSLQESLASLERYGARADVVFLHGTPTWASGKSPEDLSAERRAQPWLAQRAFFPPRDWADWERFVRVVVTAFKGRVPAWEIMNEPDLWSEGFCGEYEDYVQYLTRASRVIREVDPRAKVCLAAFVFDVWLKQIMADGLASHYDAVCIHPYHSEPAGTLSRARKAQLQMLAADALKPLLITEIGYQSGGWKEGPGVKADEAAKAAAGREALAALATVSDLVTWYTAIEKGNMYGLLRDGTDRYDPMPIYFDYGRLSGALREDAPVVASVEAPARLAPGQAGQVVLRATNRSDQP